MLYWKQKPIDSLSKEELRQALIEAVPMMINRNKHHNDRDIFSSFTIGMFCGIGCAALCVLLGSLL